MTERLVILEALLRAAKASDDDEYAAQYDRPVAFEKDTKGGHRACPKP